MIAAMKDIAIDMSTTLIPIGVAFTGAAVAWGFSSSLFNGAARVSLGSVLRMATISIVLLSSYGWLSWTVYDFYQLLQRELSGVVIGSKGMSYGESLRYITESFSKQNWLAGAVSSVVLFVGLSMVHICGFAYQIYDLIVDFAWACLIGVGPVLVACSALPSLQKYSLWGAYFVVGMWALGIGQGVLAALNVMYVDRFLLAEGVAYFFGVGSLIAVLCINLVFLIFGFINVFTSHSPVLSALSDLQSGGSGKSAIRAGLKSNSASLNGMKAAAMTAFPSLNWANRAAANMATRKKQLKRLALPPPDGRLANEKGTVLGQNQFKSSPASSRVDLAKSMGVDDPNLLAVCARRDAKSNAKDRQAQKMAESKKRALGSSKNSTPAKLKNLANNLKRVGEAYRNVPLSLSHSKKSSSIARSASIPSEEIRPVFQQKYDPKNERHEVKETRVSVAQSNGINDPKILRKLHAQDEYYKARARERHKKNKEGKS